MSKSNLIVELANQNNSILHQASLGEITKEQADTMIEYAIILFNRKLLEIEKGENK